jgi:hypothetical protein
MDSKLVPLGPPAAVELPVSLLVPIELTPWDDVLTVVIMALAPLTLK